MILADEGLNGNIVRELRELGLDVSWILEINPGIDDGQVIEIAKQNKKILITEDKDFGEWVFAHKIVGLTIIFLRYEKKDYEQIAKFLIDLLKEDFRTDHQFITINKNKIRKRKI
ncbi:MAG: toxin-antitoxin system, toxin component [Bacteroidetes bacterium]|nr:toxin-antitoxin system, toxin component [Bacteroidota bacterium]